MNTSPMMNVMKGVAIGMTAGVCMGIVGKNMVDSNPKLKKKVILVGHKPILFMAVHRADISKRNTMLGERIRLYCKAYHTERNALPELQQAG